MAAKNGAPFIGLNDSGVRGSRKVSFHLTGMAMSFTAMRFIRGHPANFCHNGTMCRRGRIFSAITDFVFMVDKTSQMFITGPKVIETVTGEKISSENLGGSKVHNTISGNAHFRADSEEEVLLMVRKLLTYLPQNNQEKSTRENGLPETS